MEKEKALPIRNVVRLTITMCLFWMLFSGYLKINLLILGVISVALVVFFSLRMEVHKHKTQPLFFPFLSLLRYWAWLFIEIFKSNITVAKMIMRPSTVKPLLKLVKTEQDTEIGRVLYANSITLTPGTVAINISKKNRNIIVHALHSDSIKELNEGEMHDHVMQLEKAIFAKVVTPDSVLKETTSDTADKNSGSAKS